MQYQRLITFGIKRLRERMGLTQEQFAEKIGLTSQGLSNLERNKYQPTSDTVDMICNAFDIHPAYLLLDCPENLDTKDLLSQINILLQTFDKKELEKVYKVLTALKN